MTTLGSRIRALRAEKDWSRAELRRRTGVGYSTIAEIENDRMHSTTKLHVFAKVLDVADEWLATGKGSRDRAPDRATVQHVSHREIPRGYIRLPQLDLPAGAGPGGATELEPETVRWLDVAKSWADKHFPRNTDHIRVLTVHGDSMVGAGIQHGDLLFVDTTVQRYIGDGYYVLQFRDGWQVKRLRADMVSQQLEIVSMLAQREDARPVPPAQEDGLRVGGKVAAWWTLRT